MTHADGEEELRRLLHDGVPRLGAPRDRMARVRRRVLRRRRARVTAAGVAVCAAGLLALTTPWTGGTPGLAATAYPAVLPRLPTAVRVGSTAVEPAGAALFPFPTARVGAILPAGWQAVMVPGQGYSIGYTAGQPLRSASHCADPALGAFACAPLTRLASPGAVVAFFGGVALKKGEPLAGFTMPFHGGFGSLRFEKPGPDCLRIGGAYEFQAEGTSGGRAAAFAFACVRGPQKQAYAEAAGILGSAAFTSDAVTQPPG